MRMIERIAEHYDMEETEFGRTYGWRPERVVLECGCGKKFSLTRSEIMDGGPDCGCGTDHTGGVREEVVLRVLDEDYELHHPWRYWHTTKDTGIPF